MGVSNQPQASVVIITRDRRNDCCKAIESALSQTAPIEIIVIDDGSGDGTAELIRERFPQVRLYESPDRLDCVIQRNHAARLAHAPVIFSIDDDAIFTSPRIVEQTLKLFDHPRVGAVTIPYVDVGHSPRVKTGAPDANGIYVTSMYIGTAHAVRRDLFLQLGGYREDLIHFGEEREYCLRMLEAGYVVRAGTADVIHHFVSPHRKLEREFVFKARNMVLFPFFNVPLSRMAVHLAGSTVNVLKNGWAHGHPFWSARGLFWGYLECIRGIRRRKPVSLSTYRLAQRLGQGELPLEQIEGQVRPMAFELPPIKRTETAAPLHSGAWFRASPLVVPAV